MLNTNQCLRIIHSYYDFHNPFSKTLVTEKSIIFIVLPSYFYLPLINRHINKTTQLPFKLNSRHFHIFESILMKIFILHKSFVSNFHCNFLFMCLNISSWCGKLLDSDYSSTYSFIII